MKSAPKITSPQDFHPLGVEFDRSVRFEARNDVTQEYAATLKNQRTKDLVELSKPQSALIEDLKQDGNIVFIGDAHLCHDFNEKAFDEILNSLEKWTKENKKISRIVLYGDIIHKFDPRFSKLSYKDRKAVAPKEPDQEVRLRLEKVLRKLDKLRSVIGDTKIDFIYGNHEEALLKSQPELKVILDEAFKQLRINVLTEDFNELVSIGEPEDKIRMSHRSIFKWGGDITKKLFGPEFALFSKVPGFLNFEKPEYQASFVDDEIIIGAHFHVPVVLNDHKNTFVMAPSLIENFSGAIPTFPEAFMVINPKASRKIHMVKVDSSSLAFQAL